jgi:hypothetical protein
MLHYFAGITTHREEVEPQADCQLMLVDGTVDDLPMQIGSHNWKLVWEGARPGDSRERMWLFQSNAMADDTAYLFHVGGRW